VKKHDGSLSVHAMPRVSIIAMIGLIVATLGLYVPIWFLRRRRALNQLDSTRKLNVWPFITATCVLAIQIPAELFVLTDGVQPLSDALNLVWTVFFIWQAFRTKRILEDHLFAVAGDLPSGVRARASKLSGVLTVFFTIFYLQHVINRQALEPGREVASHASLIRSRLAPPEA
jgi:hypothetical protein